MYKETHSLDPSNQIGRLENLEISVRVPCWQLLQDPSRSREWVCESVFVCVAVVCSVDQNRVPEERLVMHMGFGFHAPELEVLILAKTGMATIPIAIKDFWLQGKAHHTTHRRLPHCWAHASGRWCRSDAHGGGAGASVPARGDGVLHLPGQAHGGVRAAATGGQRHGCALHRQHHTGKHTLLPTPTPALQCTGLGLMGWCCCV